MLCVWQSIPCAVTSDSVLHAVGWPTWLMAALSPSSGGDSEPRLGVGRHPPGAGGSRPAHPAGALASAAGFLLAS